MTSGRRNELVILGLTLVLMAAGTFALRDVQGWYLELIATAMLVTGAFLAVLFAWRIVSSRVRRTGRRVAPHPAADSADRYAAIGALTEHFADELNAPLGTLVSAVSYAESTVAHLSEALDRTPVEHGNELLADLTEALRLARAATKQSRELSLRVREIIDYRQIGPPVPIDLAHVITRVVERFALLVPGLIEHVEILSMFSRPFRTYVEVLETTLDEVLRNALVHGFGIDIPDAPPRASKEPDQRLLTARIQIGIGPVGHSVHIRIWNNGNPMNVTRDDAAGRASRPPRGLGLFAITYLLRSVAGGSLTIDPTPGEGAGVTIDLPESAAP